MTYLVHDRSNVFSFINELESHGNFSYQDGQEVIIKGGNIRGLYQQCSIIALITPIRYLTILPESKHRNWLPQVDIVRMDNQGGETHGRPYEHVL